MSFLVMAIRLPVVVASAIVFVSFAQQSAPQIEPVDVSYDQSSNRLAVVLENGPLMVAEGPDFEPQELSFRYSKVQHPEWYRSQQQYGIKQVAFVGENRVLLLVPTDSNWPAEVSRDLTIIEWNTLTDKKVSEHRLTDLVGWTVLGQSERIAIQRAKQPKFGIYDLSKKSGGRPT